MPHTPAVQVRAAQLVSLPGHSLAALQPTQAPVPLQVLPPASVQATPSATFVNVGVPETHESAVHWCPSFGRSAASAATVTLPLPSQTFALQSAGVCAATRWPLAV